ncbi:MAG: cold shock domain-containing protein [Pseudonocardiaceae bacterium]|nr:cold shock domain-containing protein [Pseudonocardiaceae bacterium]
MTVIGSVLQFDEYRGYGFIAPRDGGEDVFVHANDLRDGKRMLTPGTAVEFDVVEGERGLKATSVRVIDAGTGGATQPTAKRAVRRAEDDSDDDILRAEEYLQELTDVLVEGVPTLTAAQIVQVRKQCVQLAREHGWVLP